MRATTLSLFLLSSSAFAQTSLGIPKVGQGTSEWCYAAATNMVGTYYGSSIRQCEVSNHNVGRTDCCSTPVPSPCVAGGDTSNELTYWGFAHTKTTTSMSFSAIKSEIDHSRPTVTGWEWTGGGHHALVIDGYWVKGDGTQHVEIINPEPVGVGDTEWAPYSSYLTGGPDDDGGKNYGTHTVSGSMFNLSWGPICSFDFNALATNQYQECSDQWTHHGASYPSAISSGSGEMAGSFRGANAPYAWANSLSDIESFSNSLTGQRPQMVTVDSSVSPVTFNAIYTSSNGQSWVTHWALDAADFQTTFNTLAPDHVLVDLYGYNDDVPRFTGTWVKKSGSYLADHEIPASSFKSMDTTNRNAGYMLTRVSTYTDGSGNPMVAALWLPFTANDYHWYLGVTDSTYQSDYNSMSGSGYTLAYTSQEGSNYNLIFTK